MNQFSAPVSTTQPPIIAAKQDAFDRLTFLGWRTGLMAIVAGLAASFFLFGYALIYWRNADMDLMVIYNALVLNDGKPQVFFDHTAYLTILALKLWFQLLHTLGLLDAYSLSAIPPASNAAAFDAAMTGAVRAGRVLAWLIATGFDRALLDAAHFHPLLLSRFGLYQAALLALIAACMIAYAAIWQVSAAETLASMFAVAAGASIALLALDVQYDANNVIAVLNPLEKMLTFADANTTDVANGSSLSGILLLLLDGVASVLARYSFVLHSSARPTVFLTWLIVPGIIVAWRRGEKLVAIQAFALLMAAIGIDALGVRRGLKSEYFIFTDPLIIIAGAILLDCLSDLRFRKWAYPLAVTLFGLHIAIGQAEPIKYALKRSGPESTCEWSRYYLPLLPLPWCAGPPTRS